MKKTILGSLIVVTSLISVGDVLLPNNSTIADIQSAIDNAQPGDVISLADGTYNVDQTLYVTNGVTLKGTDRDACLFVGDGTTPLAAALVIDQASSAMNLTVSNISVGVANDYTFGGAVRIVNGLFTQARVTGCRVTYASGNRTGGVSLEGSSANVAAMTHCMVDHNSSSGAVGGVRFSASAGTMANCVVWANSGKTAGGVGIINPTAWQPANVVNCTVAGNSASGQGGGINVSVANVQWQGTSYVLVVNTIIAGNDAPEGVDMYFGNDDSKNYSGFNCLCQTADYGTNPQSGDPLFVRAESGNFNLKHASPARSAGDADKAASVLGYSLVGTVDFYGQPRVKFVSRKGIPDIDIGAAESKYSPIGLRISFR